MITIELPLPPRACSGNGSHGHWRTVSTSRKQYREECRFVALAALRDARWETPQRVTVALLFGIKGARAVKRYAPRDEANAIYAFKAGIDGLIDAGLAPDDSGKHLSLGGVSLTSDAGPWVRAVVTTESAP